MYKHQTKYIMYWKKINHFFSFSHLVFISIRNAFMILLVLHASYKETLQNNTVIFNNRWFTQQFIESNGIGVQQILMKPHYSCVAWLFNYFRLWSWRSVLENNYLEPFFLAFTDFLFSPVWSNLLFVELKSEKTGQNIETVLGAIGAGVLFLITIVIIAYIFR